MTTVFSGNHVNFLEDRFLVNKLQQLCEIFVSVDFFSKTFLPLKQLGEFFYK